MWFKKICTLSLILFFANVDYAQLITINALGKYITKGKESNASTKKPVQSRAVDSFSSSELESQSNIAIKGEGFSLPLSYLTITSLFGQRYHPILHYNKLHAGIDLRANYEAVFAFAEGIITKAGYD